VGATAVAGAASGAPQVSVTPTKAGSLLWAVGQDPDRAAPRTPLGGQSVVHESFGLPGGGTAWVQATGPVAAANSPITLGPGSGRDPACLKTPRIREAERFSYSRRWRGDTLAPLLVCEPRETGPCLVRRSAVISSAAPRKSIRSGPRSSQRPKAGVASPRSRAMRGWGRQRTSTRRRCPRP
jgi:hypothetical protein